MNSRIAIRLLIFALICSAAVGVILGGVQLTEKQSRVDDLTAQLGQQQQKLKGLFDQRNEIVKSWIALVEASQTGRDKVPETSDATTDATAESSEVQDNSAESNASSETTKADASNVPANQKSATIIAAIDQSRGMNLLSQVDLDRFERLQVEISSFVASALLPQIRQLTTELKADPKTEEKSHQINEQILNFANLDMEIEQIRREFNVAAGKKNQLIDALEKWTLGLGPAPEETPIWTSEASR